MLPSSFRPQYLSQSHHNNLKQQLEQKLLNQPNYEDDLVFYIGLSDNNPTSQAASLIPYLLEKGKENSNELISLCEKLVKSTSPTAELAVGWMHYKGYGHIQQNYDTAKEKFEAVAEKGLLEAKAFLGEMYFNGFGVEKNDDTAVKLYKEAADQGNVKVQSSLGAMYANGRGVSRDDDEAVRLFQLAADQGNARAQCNLGVMYENGRGVSRNDAEAVRLYQLAADQGNAIAQCNLGVMYENGRGVSRNDAEAVRLYQLAADQGNAIAQCNLGFMYANGRGVSRNYVKAAGLYQLAAHQGNATAQCNLGVMYANGRGKVSPETETMYFKAMSELNVKGDVYLFLLGMRYLKGEGVDRQSHTKAREHLKMADQLGHPSANFYLAESYRTAGIFSGRQNHEEAQKYYSIAAKTGNKQAEAKAALEEYYPKTKTFQFGALSDPQIPSNVDGMLPDDDGL